ncbi:MAG: flagellar hook-associated protein FlgL [Rhodocyclaceae bacterium]|nr:flagellar hook-associated protein FlgL [Rhodocyclaceae bacterium]
MRIATSQIFDANVATINRQWASLLHLQQQVATGRRVLTPADDPVAAARALEVQQSQSVLSQFRTNHDSARSALGLEEAQLSSAGDLLARIKELAVQGGNAALSAADRRALAMELRARYDELLGLANAADGQGIYLFAGFMGTTKPFGGTVDALNATPTSEIQYFGDDGVRKLQVAAARHLEISDPGRDVFVRIRNGNGYFVTQYAATNTGTGIIDSGYVTDPTTWNALPNKNFEIRFYVDSSVTPNVTYYDLVDTTANVSLLTGAPPTTPPPYTGLRVYEEGQPILLHNQGAEPPFDLGGYVVITGQPANNDLFTLSPASHQSVFKTLAKLIKALEDSTATNDAARAAFANDLGFALRDLAQAEENILRVRAAIGARLSELDSLSETSADLQLQYQQTLSTLTDLDYAKAISDLTRKQTDLQAAQQSFVRISQLSLFDYLR